jgi:hypothetical protein
LKGMDRDSSRKLYSPKVKSTDTIQIPQLASLICDENHTTFSNLIAKTHLE